MAIPRGPADPQVLRNWLVDLEGRVGKLEAQPVPRAFHWRRTLFALGLVFVLYLLAMWYLMRRLDP